jgi:putative peptidoglycan lipid II flippase
VTQQDPPGPDARETRDAEAVTERIAIGDVEAVSEPEVAAAADAAIEDPSGATLVKSSAAMATGTVASRITGTLRDILILAAVGTREFSDTYSVGNTVPNIIYILLAGGALNAIFIPQLVRHMKSDDDDGDDYAQRLLTSVALILVGLTVVSVLAAPLLARLYGPRTWSANDIENATLFARYCLPQILFYGLFAMFSQVLNARGRFASPMYAPIANNVIVIATAILFIKVVGTHDPSRAHVTHQQIALLGIGTTIGIVVQAAILIPMMARVGFVWRPRFGFRGYGLGRARYLAGWTFLFVLTNQLTYVVIARLASAANVIATNTGASINAGFTSYTKAYLLFVLPHSIITVSIITFLLPRMSRAAADGDPQAVGSDIGLGTKLACALIAPAAVMLFILGPRIGFVLFGWGATSNADARFLGVILQAFVIGLVPYTIFYVLLRGFYAFEDTRTPALINIGTNVVNLVCAVALYFVVPDYWKVPALAFGYALAYAVTIPVMWRYLARKTGRLPTYDVVRTLVRVSVAAILTGLVMAAVLVPTTALVGTGRLGAILTGIIAGAAGAGAYLWLAGRMRIGEVNTVIAMVRTRLARA